MSVATARSRRASGQIGGLVAKLMAIGLALVCALSFPSVGSTRPVDQQKPAFGLNTAPSKDGAATGSSGESSNITHRLWSHVVGSQRALITSMVNALRHLKTGNLITSSAVLAAISFLYGVLHAAAPGHGKLVISSYALANGQTVRRGVLLSFMAALVQALSAVTLGGLLTVILKTTSLELRLIGTWLERASWGLIALFGLWLLFGQVRQLWRGWRGPEATRDAPAHHKQDHDLDDDHRRHHADGRHALHSSGCARGPCCGGRAHLATPSQLAGQWSWAKAWTLALSVGIRPCTGALGVLIFAFSLGIFWAGIFAVFAMAIGTAITVSFLTTLAVGSRELAERIVGVESGSARRIRLAAGMLGATLILITGAMFFVASLQGLTAL